MRICERLGEVRPAFSFEFFPPKTAKGEEQLFETIDHLRPLDPCFVSVTYGAGGSTRAKTVDLVSRIKHEIGLESMAHLTCVGADRDEIASVLRQLRDHGIENVLALRGDPPGDAATFTPPANGFAHASELVSFIRASGFEFCLAGAAYPEKHVEAIDIESDVAHLRHKVDCGLDLLITQLFFANDAYESFVARARSRGIEVPILPGIMPITDFGQIERFTSMCGARIPPALRARLEPVRDDHAAVRAIGIEYATAQCRELLAMGAPGIHFYTLNRSTATRAIVEQLEA